MKGKTKAKPKPKGRPKEVGPAIGQNKATPVDRIKALEGFNVELLYSVPGGAQGSWVALAPDNKGNIYASDQYGDLYRFPAPAPGKKLQQKDVTKVPVNIRAINGMIFADGHLYAGRERLRTESDEWILSYFRHRQRWRARQSAIATCF
jgi:hypothetical protein